MKKKEPVKAPVIKAPEIKIIPKSIKPLIIETIAADGKDIPAFEKRVYKGLPTKLEEGYIRVVVLKDHNTMSGELLRDGDILDLPERRYKSLSFRGMVKIYEGKNLPNKQR